MKAVKVGEPVEAFPTAVIGIVVRSPREFADGNWSSGTTLPARCRYSLRHPEKADLLDRASVANAPPSINHALVFRVEPWRVNRTISQ